MTKRNVPASVRSKLLGFARSTGQDFSLVLTRYAIRKDANYAGVRVNLAAMLDGARSQVQVDIGYGDAVTPAPEDVEYPVILAEFDAPRLRAYPRYTVVAEKFEAICSLGLPNTRLKDYFDLWILAQHSDFDGETLHRAIGATFERRGTAQMKGLMPLGWRRHEAQIQSALRAGS